MSCRYMVGLPPSTTGALGGGETQRQRTQGEDDHVTMEAETGARHPESRSVTYCWQYQNLREKHGTAATLDLSEETQP